MVDFEEEMTNTRKLLERVPLNDAHRGYQPHQKSMTLERLATHVAEAPGMIQLGLEHDVYEMTPGHQQPVAGSTSELLATFDAGVTRSRAAIAAATDEAMTKDWTFKFGDLSLPMPRTEWIRAFLNHTIHHRAQLGVYLRLNGIPVPGMYGPSADDAWPPPAA